MPLIVPATAPWGTHDCRLDYYDGTRVILRRYGGKYLMTGMTPREIPVNGVILNLPGTPSGTHRNEFVYAYMNVGVLTLYTDSVGYVIDPNGSGMPVHSGNYELTLVGIIWNQNGGIDGPRLACSYWNRKWYAQMITPAPSTTANAMVDLGTRIYWMGFAGDAYQVFVSGTSVNDTLYGINGVLFQVADQVGNVLASGNSYTTFPGYTSIPLGMRGTLANVLTAGLQNAGMYGICYGGGTATWYPNFGVRVAV